MSRNYFRLLAFQWKFCCVRAYYDVRMVTFHANIIQSSLECSISLKEILMIDDTALHKEFMYFKNLCTNSPVAIQW